MASRSPLVCFLLTVAGLAHLLMVPWKLCLRFLRAGWHMDIVDCRVAPMGTAVYGFISHTFLSLSPQHRWARSLNTWCPRLLATVFCSGSHIDEFLCRATEAADASLGLGNGWKNTGKPGTAELEVGCPLSGQCFSIPGRVCVCLCLRNCGAQAGLNPVTLCLSPVHSVRHHA